MSANVFTRLLDEFRQGWVDSGSKLFNLEIRLPGQFSTGNPGVPDTINYQTEEYVSSVCLPSTAAADDSTEAVVVVAKGDDQRAAYLPSKDAIDNFKRLCSEAGAALPTVIRNHLARYHSWMNRDPASWWVSLLVCLHEFTVRNDEGAYQEEQFITNPWEASIDAIECLRLNTDSPRWPVAGMESTVTDLITYEEIAKLAGVTVHTVENTVSAWRNARYVISRPCRYATVQTLCVEKWPRRKQLFPADYQAMKTILNRLD